MQKGIRMPRSWFCVYLKDLDLKDKNLQEIDASALCWCKYCSAIVPYSQLVNTFGVAVGLQGVPSACCGRISTTASLHNNSNSKCTQHTARCFP